MFRVNLLCFSLCPSLSLDSSEKCLPSSCLLPLSAKGGLGWGERSMPPQASIWVRAVLQEVNLLGLYYQKIKLLKNGVSVPSQYIT